MNKYTLGLRLLQVSKKLLLGIPKVKAGQTTPPNHNPFTDLLQKYVDERGGVNYEAWQKDRAPLKAYLQTLSEQPPHPEKWPHEAQLAYWINAYNAFTIDIILDYYPVRTIKQIGGKITMFNSTWDVKFFKIGGVPFDLNTIEHEILRKDFQEPRIHFVTVCASYSCPRLLREAYTPENLEHQLERQSRFFINNLDKNNIQPHQAKLSQIFEWFATDFAPNTPKLVQYINRYSNVQIQPDAQISYRRYNWNLNTPEAYANTPPEN